MLHAANSLKRLTDLSAKPKMPLFLTFYQFYLGLGGPFQSGSVHLEYDIKFERVDVKFGTIDIRSAVLVASAPALFVLFAELFASRRKKPSNIEQLSDSFVAMEFLNCGVASLLLLALCTHIINTIWGQIIRKLGKIKIYQNKASYHGFPTYSNVYFADCFGPVRRVQKDSGIHRNLRFRRRCPRHTCRAHGRQRLSHKFVQDLA